MTVSFVLPRHPLGVKPAGNALVGPRQIQRPFKVLPDEILISILEILDTRSLLALGTTCRALYAFSRFDDLWRARMIESALVPETWKGTWYSSFAGIVPPALASVSVEELASDVLYRPFLCANTPVTPYISHIPGINSITRMDNLTLAEFSANWVDKPFILTKPVTEWPVYREWSPEMLLYQYRDVVFRAEAVDWPLSTYLQYMDNNCDESPLYLFDHRFVEKMGIMTGKEGDFWAPDCFGEDLFAVLGDQRPDSRWLIIGPERSGSTFHKDPNATSAWNAVIRGSKYWIMFPNRADRLPPPGVFVSADQSEVTSPLSIAEWLLAFHEQARTTSGCIEGICNAGEVLHVPSGWWHLVVNIEPSIAITQNFVPEAHLHDVLTFMRDKSNQVSGFSREVRDPYAVFKQALEEKYPEMARKALAAMANMATHKKRKWDELIRGQAYESGFGTRDGGGFNFGFDNEHDAVPDDDSKGIK